ncbi:MAG: signal peptidase I [Candidatus Bathyarchaeota archaeon]|nr:signal peptidase I [Candidatus Bathyarchaeota archaeon]
MNAASKKDAVLRELRGLWKNGVLRTVFLLLLVLLGNFILQQALVLILKTETPLHTPISGSMEPTLKIGDMLIIQGGLSADDIYANFSNGDIVIFRDPRNPESIPIVHRAIDKYQIGGTWYIVTKGDNNAYPDDWAGYFPRGGTYNKAGHPEDYLIGKVVFVIPFAGYALRLLDETAIRIGGYSITLRMVFIVFLVAAFFFLELTSSSEKTEGTEGQKEEESSRELNH